jgi:dual specificity tyrosine-phosphorylation-regulated kinase 2/3/4
MLQNPSIEHLLLEIQHHFTFRGHVCIATEALSLSLLDLMLASADGSRGTSGLSLQLIRRFADQLVLALAVLHRHGIIHHEVKPKNVLLVHPTRSDIKLANFGSSCLARETGGYDSLSHSRMSLTLLSGMTTMTMQSRWYRAPEVIVGEPHDMSVDMWSLGCLLGELYTGFPLFAGEGEQEQIACMREVLGVPEVDFVPGSSPKHKLFGKLISLLSK